MIGIFDNTILTWLHGIAQAAGSVLTPVMRFVTLVGEKGILMFLVAFVLMLFPKTRKAGVCIFGAVCCGALITNVILKDTVARLRPFEADALYREWWQFVGSPHENGFSFPSGHVTAACAGMSALCLTRGKKWVIPSVAYVVVMAVSRNYLMAHYPSDVVAAVLVGLFSALVAYLIANLIFSFLEKHRDSSFFNFILDFDVRTLGKGKKEEK